LRDYKEQFTGITWNQREVDSLTKSQSLKPKKKFLIKERIMHYASCKLNDCLPFFETVINGIWTRSKTPMTHKVSRFREITVLLNIGFWSKIRMRDATDR
jgi:hypothetical protein